MERKEADVHVRLSSSERMALERLAAKRGTSLSKMVRGTLAEVFVMGGVLQDPAANNAGEHCAVCESTAARPVGGFMDPEDTFAPAEYQLSFTVYPLDADQAQQLRERLQDLILKEIEARGLFMGPVLVESTREIGNEQA